MRAERVDVSREHVLDEAVVGRVPGRGEQHAVQPDPPGGMVHLVLVALALGDLDDDVNVQWFRSMPVRMVYSIVSMIPGGRSPGTPWTPGTGAAPSARPSPPCPWRTVSMEKW